MPRHGKARMGRRGAAARGFYVAGGLSYPLWHLLAPSRMIDPWWIWWVVGGCLLFEGLRPRWDRVVEVSPWPSALLTIHLFGLVAVNRMAPFYLTASAGAVVTTIAFLDTPIALRIYTGLVALLSAVLYAAHPSPEAIFYGVALVSVVGWSYAAREADRVREEGRERHAQKLELEVGERDRRLRRASDRISQEVFERRRLEQELQVAQSMGAVARLAGSVAHEFNNQLMTVRVFADLLKRRLHDEEARDDVERILGATEHGARLTRQILTLSRPIGEMPEPVDLGAAVQAELPALRARLPKVVRIVAETGPERVLARVDPHELVQVIVNLAINAGDAMPEGGELRIEVGAVAPRGLGLPEFLDAGEEGELARLAVSDTGVGIPAAHRERIFEPFFTTKARDAGSGMGLAVVWGIVTRHGGHVRVESEEGQGTRFELYWPRALASAGAEPPEPDRAPAPGAGQRILLVDDEPDVLAGLARVLEEAGYDVVMAADGESALRLVAESPCDMIATDAVMPGMGGAELLERAQGLRPGIRGLLFSGHLGGGGRRKPEGVPVLSKPFDPDTMLRSIREVIRAPRAP